jgi:hypothetical protein
VRSIGNTCVIVEIEWVSASDGGVDAYWLPQEVLDKIKGLFLFAAETVPKSPAPTASYNVAVKDGYGLNPFGTSLNGRSASAAEAVAATIVLPVTDLMIEITSNSVADASALLRLYLRRVY